VFANASLEILPRLYSAADFAICPSRYEAFGYVVAEALACGTPVVASPGGASRFLLSDSPLRECLISNSDAASDFLAAIRSILNDPGHYRGLVDSAIRPKIEEAMKTDNWANRFLEATGL
jgi:D-inositol-3-phosphate glycosyltransferase